MTQAPASTRPAQTLFPKLELLIVAAAAVFVFLMEFKLPFYPIFTEEDELIFLYEAWRMMNGDVIYRDFFEFVTPGSQVYYYAALSLVGNKYWLLPATVVLLAAGCSFMTLSVSRRLIDGPLYLLPAITFVFFGFRWFGPDGSHRMFSPILIMAAVFVVLRGTDNRRLLLAGGLCALTSFFTQQRGFVALVALGIFVMVEAFRSASPMALGLKRVGVLIAAYAAIFLIICLPFIAFAGAGNFFDSIVVYPALYYGYGSPNNYGIYLVDLQRAFTNHSASGLFALLPTLLYALFLPISILGIAAWLLTRKGDWEAYRKPTLIAIVSVLALLATTAPNQYRLYQISMPALVLVVWCAGRVISSRAGQTQLVTAAAVIFGLISAFQAFRQQTYWEFKLWETPTGTLAYVPDSQNGRFIWLGERMSPGESFFEVYEPFAYFPLQLKNPTRYGQIWPSEYTRPEHVSETVRDLTTDPPRYILWDNGYNLSPENRKPGDNTGPLAEFVQANYEPVEPVYPIAGREIQIWHRRSSGQ